MKRSETIGLTFALVALAAVPAVEAQETPRVAVRDAATVQRQADPFVLVNLARRGYFENFSSLGRLRQTNATELVKAGIEQGRVAPEALNDRGYLHAVESHLRTLTNTR